MSLARLLNQGLTPAQRMSAKERIHWSTLLRWIQSMRYEYCLEREVQELVDLGGES